MDEPTTLTINAWTGSPGPVSDDAPKRWRSWSVRREIATRVGQHLFAAEPVDLRDWEDPRVGWGLVLPDNETITEKERAIGADAPQPIRELLEQRKHAPVFRYRPDLGIRFLRRYYPDGSRQDPATSGSEPGTQKGQIPYYLLIYGSPKEIPWDLQYVLNVSRFVGRLDLRGKPLENYINSLLAGWKDATARPEQPVVWAVDYGQDDITWLMRYAIAEPVSQKLAADNQIGDRLRYLAGDAATADDLIQMLAERTPALVVTTSHGMTGPLNDPAAMAHDLGIPVDQNHNLLQPDKLLTKWQPNGAIWYAHACCSAGSDSKSNFTDLVTPGSPVEQVLQSVAGLGAQIAPLPQALLGAEKPLRAFIGHVEPTFDWTIRQPETKQVLTASIRTALYDKMYRQRPEPVGMAFRECYRHVGELFTQWAQARQAVNAGNSDFRVAALRTQLAALDRQSIVILGDPTACLPALA